MTGDVIKSATIIGGLIAAGLLINAASMVSKAQGAPRLQVTYDNDGHIFARVASPQKARYGKRTGRRHSVARHRKPVRSVTLVGVVPELAIKARAIVAECGSTVVSAVARRGNRSNHPIGRAVDLRGNPRCIYKLLVGWPGGVSTDYATAPGGPHVHVSYNPRGQEWGLRFAHRHRVHRTRYARAHYRGGPFN